MTAFWTSAESRSAADTAPPEEMPQKRPSSRASLRGGVGFAAFAGAKHALRALAQSMARELGPQGIHVAQIIVDAAIDTEFIRENFPQRYALKEREGIVDPEAIAESYWQLHLQPRNAWTHELDLRPWIEPW